MIMGVIKRLIVMIVIMFIAKNDAALLKNNLGIKNFMSSNSAKRKC